MKPPQVHPIIHLSIHIFLILLGLSTHAQTVNNANLAQFQAVGWAQVQASANPSNWVLIASSPSACSLPWPENPSSFGGIYTNTPRPVVQIQNVWYCISSSGRLSGLPLNNLQPSPLDGAISSFSTKIGGYYISGNNWIFYNPTTMDTFTFTSLNTNGIPNTNALIVYNANRTQLQAVGWAQVQSGPNPTNWTLVASDPTCCPLPWPENPASFGGIYTNSPRPVIQIQNNWYCVTSSGRLSGIPLNNAHQSPLDGFLVSFNTQNGGYYISGNNWVYYNPSISDTFSFTSLTTNGTNPSALSVSNANTNQFQAVGWAQVQYSATPTNWIIIAADPLACQLPWPENPNAFGGIYTNTPRPIVKIQNYWYSVPASGIISGMALNYSQPSPLDGSTVKFSNTGGAYSVSGGNWIFYNPSTPGAFIFTNLSILINPPTITITTPTNLATYNFTNITITGTATNGDGHAVTVILYTNSISSVITTSTVTRGKFTNNITLTPGTNTIIAQAISDGFISNAVATVFIEGPPRIQWIQPVSGTYAWSYNPKLQTTITDPLNLVSNLTAFYYEGTNYLGKAPFLNSYSLTYSNLFQTGSHTLFATVTNTAGFSARSTNSFTILADRPPTNVELVTPTTSTNLTGTYTMQATATDLDGDPLTVTFYDGSTALATNNLTFTTRVYLGRGVHQLYVAASSTSFIVFSSTNILTLDTLPTVTWVSPTNSMNQNSTNLLQVTTTGNPITQVIYTNNGAYVGTSTTASNNYAIGFTANTPGTNVLIATATDIYGVSASATNLLNVQGFTFAPYFITPICSSVLIPAVLTPQVTANGDPVATVSYSLDGQTFTGSITNPTAGIQHTLVANCTSLHGLQASATNTFTATEIATWKLINLSTHAETPLSRSTCAFYKVTADNSYLVTPVYLTGFAPNNTTLTVLQGPPGWQYASNQTAVQLSTNSGTLVIQVSSSTTCGTATYNFDLSSGCITCTTCTDGGTKVANKSVNVRINLGSSSIYGTAGFLEVEQGSPTADLGTPKTLAYDFSRPDVQTVLDGNGYLSQIIAPDGLFTITTIDANTYSVSFYPRSQVINSNGVYGATGYPSRVITLGNIGGDTTHFQVNDSDKGIVADYYWLGQGWNMVTGGGLRQENKQEVDTGNQQAITRQILDGAGSVVYQTYEVWADLPSGKNPLLQVTGTGSAAKTNSYTYDSNGLLTQENHADGSWTIYQYDSQGRQTDKFSPFLNSAPATDSSGRHETYSYDTANVSGSGDDGTQMPNSPRLTINYIQGQEVLRNYTAYLPNERIDVQCTTPGATWNATGNLGTYTFYSTDVNHYGEVTKEVHPDGTVDTYTWIAAGGTNQYNEEIHKQGAVDGSGNFTQGTEEDTFTDPATTRLVGRMVGDIASGLLTSQEVYSYDEQVHLTNTVHLDNTAEGSSYDCCHMLNTTDKTGLITTYGYDAIDRQVSVLRSGITTSNVLDANGSTLGTYRTGTNGTTQLTSASTYDNAGTLTSSQDAVGNTTIYSESVDASGQTVKTTTVLAVTKTQIYAQDGSLLAEMGPTGGTTNVYSMALNGGVLQAYTKSIKLDTNGGPTGEWTQTFTDGAGRTTTTVDSDGGSTTSSYNALGQLSSQAYGDGATTLYSYNPLGQVELQAVDVNQNGQIDLSGLDRIVQVERDVTAFNGHTVNRTQTYDYPTDNSGAATLISMTAQAVDAQIAWNYSGSGTNTTAITLTGNGATTTTQTGADGTVSTITYQAGRVVSQNTSDAAGTSQNQTFSYDEFNRLASVTDARNGVTSYTYDAADRVTSVTSPAAGDGTAPQVTTTSYDAYGNPWLTGLPDGSYKTNIYNLDGTLQMSMGSQTYPQAYTYDYAGRVKTITTWGQAGTAVTTWNYNNRGLLTSKQYADGHGPSYTYTTGGRLATKTSARGIVTTYSYNGGGSLSGVSYSDGEPSITLGYNRLGLVNAVTGNINSSLSYNAFGQLLEEDLTGTGYASQVQYGYDALNRLQTITSPTLGTVSTIGYTGSRITSVAGNGLTAQYGYINNSPLLSGVIVSGSGGAISASSRQYDHLNRLQSLQASPSAFGVAYSYNSLNQRTARTNNLDSSIWNYGYDGLGQVTVANKTIGTQLAAGQQFGYTYDTVGNRLNNTFGGDNTGSNKRQVNYTANTLNQYTQRSYPGYVEVNGIANPSDTLFVGGNSPTWQGNNFWQELGFDNSWIAIQTNIDIWDISATATNYTGYGVLLPKNPETLTYDLDGNLTQDSQWSYTWNAENKLIHMQNSSGMSLDFSYDLQGRRVSKVVTVNGTVTSSKKFYYDGWNLIGEVDSTSGIGIAYNWGLDLSQSLQGAGGVGGLISMTVSGSSADGTYVYQYDGNGNVIGMIDANGNSAAQYEYGPFGETVVASGYAAGLNSFGFSTKSKDMETGLSFYPARPGYPGMWISRDPSEENGGANLYNFCNNDGVNFVDPAGLALYAFDGTGNFQEQRDSVELLYESYLTKYKWYEKGVGVHSWDLLGGGFGAGVSSRIREVWKKFLEYYPHDQTIDIIGFSRGAAEAREFANLLNERGYNPDYQRFYFKNHNTCPVKIRFVGLFDTVGSVGLPGSQLNPGIRMNLPPNVQNAAQALAHDEHRQKFPFTQLNLPGVGQHFQQAIFPGDHSDIGGAWVEKRNQLSKAPLEYIWSAGRSAGVPFGPIPTYPFTQGIKPNDNTHAFPYIIDQVLGLNGPRNFTTTWTH